MKEFFKELIKDIVGAYLRKLAIAILLFLFVGCITLLFYRQIERQKQEVINSVKEVKITEQNLEKVGEKTSYVVKEFKEGKKLF